MEVIEHSILKPVFSSYILGQEKEPRLTQFCVLKWQKSVLHVKTITLVSKKVFICNLQETGMRIIFLKNKTKQKQNTLKIVKKWKITGNDQTDPKKGTESK